MCSPWVHSSPLLILASAIRVTDQVAPPGSRRMRRSRCLHRVFSLGDRQAARRRGIVRRRSVCRLFNLCLGEEPRDAPRLRERSASRKEVRGEDPLTAGHCRLKPQVLTIHSLLRSRGRAAGHFRPIPDICAAAERSARIRSRPIATFKDPGVDLVRSDSGTARRSPGPDEAGSAPL